MATKKLTVWIVLCFTLLGSLVILGYWLFDNNGYDWTFESKNTKCLTKPFATIPLPMPQTQPDQIKPGQLIYRLDYHFPSWWRRQPLNIDDPAFGNPTFEKIVADGNYIWLTFYSPDTQIARYDPEKNELKRYPVQDDENEPFSVTDIYLASDKTLWVTLSNTQPGGGYSALARYRQDSAKFEVIADQDGLFMQSQETTSDPSDKHLGELPDGRLVVVLGWKIYLYDPISNHAEILLGDEKVESIEVGLRNDIWFVNILDDYTLKNVNTATGKVVNYGVPPNLGKQIKTQLVLTKATKAISVDRQGNVWISYFDKLEPSQNGEYNWHSLELPSVFINTHDPVYKYRWANVYKTQASSDGSIWFASDIGVVKYDPVNPSWCLSATVNSFGDYPFAQDAEGDIWTVVDGQIYNLEP